MLDPIAGQLADLRVKMEQYYMDNRRYSTTTGGGTCGIPGGNSPTTPGTKYFTFTCASTAANAAGDQQYTLTATGVAVALRAALRQAPKVILVGEMRDRETIEVALEAAETGHLVLSTLHTIDASKTIDRIIGVFPKNEERAIRTRIAQSFRYIVSQRLIPRPDGQGRVAAIEILKSTMRTREYIEKGESEGKSLVDAMEQGDQEGMQTFDSVIEQMVRSGVLTQEAAMPYATNASNMLLRLGDLGGSPVSAAAPAPKEDDSMLDMIER